MTWGCYKAAVADHNAVQKVNKVEYLRAQDQALASKVEEHADLNFPVKCLLSTEHISPFIGSAQATWAEAKQIPPGALFTVYVVNLTALGSQALRACKECIRLVSDACAHCPERTCAVFFGPNVGGHGHTYDERELEKCQDDCEAALKLDEAGLRVRRGQVVFDPESISSRTRSSVHPLWMCFSNQTNADGDLACKFRTSVLWHRRALHGVQMKSQQNFVIPFQGVTPVLPANFSKAQTHKQHIAGVDLLDKLKATLWKGMDLSANHGAALVDVLPYDDSLLLSTLQSSAKTRPKEPQEMVISCIWARGDQEGDKRRAHMDWLRGATQRGIDRMVRANLLFLQGFNYKEYTTEAAAPSNAPQLYALTFPTAEGHLALRQTALDEWCPKFARLRKDFDAAVEKHNKAFNPSGFPFKGDGQKRPAPGAGVDEEGKAFPADSVVESLEALKKLEGSLSTVASYQTGVQLVFTAKGGLYLHALEDTTVSAKLPLMQIFGEFHSGEAEIAKVEKKKCPVHAWQINSLDYEAIWGHPAAWDPGFKQSLASYKEFVHYLADHNIVSFTMVCHALNLEPENESITPDELCLFEPKKLPPKANAEPGNCGSLLAWSAVDWEKGRTLNGLLSLHMKLLYEDSSQAKGIYPTKPVWILAEARKVEKGKCYLVVPAPKS